jgi:hypothetical protein
MFLLIVADSGPYSAFAAFAAAAFAALTCPPWR